MIQRGVVTTVGTLALTATSVSCARQPDMPIRPEKGTTVACVDTCGSGGRLYRKVESESCLELHAEPYTGSSCGRNRLCVRLRLAGTDCVKGVWANTAFGFPSPGRAGRVLTVDVVDANTGEVAPSSCISEPAFAKWPSEYVYFVSGVAVERQISTSCYRLDQARDWRVRVRYRDTEEGPRDFELMQDWFVGELTAEGIVNRLDHSVLGDAPGQ